MGIKYFISDYDNNEIEAVERVLKSGNTGHGEEVEKLEEEFKAIEGCEYCIAVNSATSGLILAGLVSPYQKCYVPSNTFIATYQAALIAKKHKKQIEIIDIENPKYTPLNFFPRATNYNVHIGGKYVTAFQDFTISDCAHMVPGMNNDYGDIAVFSFFGNKNIHSGDGGMITTDNKKYYDKIKSLVYHGFHNRDGYNYNVRADAFKFEMNNITAAIVRQQLKKLEWKQQERKRVYEFYYKNLKEFVYMDSPENHSFHLAIVEFEIEEQREKVESELKKHDIGFSMHYRPLYIVDQTLYKDKYKDYNHTKRYKRWLSLPIYPKLSSCDVEYICDVIRSVL